MKYTPGSSTQFLRFFPAAAFLVVGSCFLLNVLIDPLWFFGGNKLQPKNFVFNERVAKTALLSRQPGHYDCIIFGSSRVTLINEKKIKGFRCFNYGVSAGTAVDSLYLARIAKKYVKDPRLILIGVEDFNWIRSRPLDSSKPPRPLSRMLETPSSIAYYFGLAALGMSVKTLLDLSPSPRFYDDNFTIKIRSGEHALREGTADIGLDVFPTAEQVGKNVDAAVQIFRRIRLEFPSSKVVGFVPFTPIEVIRNNLAKIGIDNYLQSQIVLGSCFDEFWDFSVPSEVTSRREWIYDGNHFYPSANELLVSRIIEGEPGSLAFKLSSADGEGWEAAERYEARLSSR